MRKGLTTTLMAVAVAIMAMQVMAMAPVIGEIPSPVVGNLENVTPAQGFVYPDAIDLTKYVTDLESNSSQIIWSYEIVGTPKYKINFKDSMVTGTDDPVSPGAKALNTMGVNTGDGAQEANFDNNPLTITIRNTNLSPVPGWPGNDVSTTPGILTGESQPVVFYASDETTFTASKPVWFYSENLANDHLSPGRTPVWDWTAADGSTGWRYSPVTGSVTSSFSGTNGVCLQVAAGANNKGAAWLSPYGNNAAATIELVKNAVYRIRVSLTSSQSNVGQVPYFDVYVAQFDQISGNYYGQNFYGANFFVHCQAADGGANGLLSPGKDYDFWWAPACVSTTRWNADTESGHNGPFNSAMVDQKNAFVGFRVLAYGAASGGYPGQDAANGTICLKLLEIDRADLGSLQTVSTVWQTTAGMTPSSGGGLFYAPDTRNTNVQFSGGKCTVTPSGTVKDQFAQVVPGNGVGIDYMTESTNVDDYPCPMDPQTLYLVTMGISAPAQTDMDNPPNMFWVGADTLTNELLQMNFVSSKGWHFAMPSYSSADTPQDYKMFFYSNYATSSSNPSWWSCFRPRFMTINDLNDAGEAQTGAVRLHSVKVDQVIVP